MNLVAPPLAATSTDLAPSIRKFHLLEKSKTWMLIGPLLALIAVFLLYPISIFFIRSFYDPQIADGLPRTVEALKIWTPGSLPIPEQVFAAMRGDLLAARANGSLGSVAGRINQAYPGARSLMITSARRLSATDQGPVAPIFKQIGPAWNDPALWGAIRNGGARFTIDHFLETFDYARTPNGSIVHKSADQSINVSLFVKTFKLAGAITALCLMLAYPIAFVMAHISARSAKIVMLLIMLPFLTSILVKITSWIVLLQREGVVNDLLVWAGITTDANRLELMYNMGATAAVGTHILLPFAILPLFSVMKSIPDDLTRAAISLGGSSFQAFRRVYFPLTLPGIVAGGSFVFIMATGYYITPALVGGQSGLMISNVIAYNMQVSLDWGLAAAVSVTLLVTVLMLYGASLGFAREKSGT